MKPTLFPFSTRIATLALGALIAFGAQAQTVPASNGRLLFKQKNCSLCHFFEARNVAPSVKTMKRELKGDPAKTSAAISAAASHSGELKSWSAAEIRSMSEWLAGISFEEQAAAEAAKPKPGSPEAKRQAAAKAKQEAAAKAKAAEEAKAQAKKDAEAKAKAAAEAKAQAKKDAAAKAKQEAEAKAQAGKDSAAKAKQEAEAKAQAARDTEAQAKREAAAKKEKEDLAKREADAKARKDTAALDAIKREGEERAKREAEAQAGAKREAEAKAKRDADALAAQKREADERNRAEAEARSKKEADAVAAQKREAEAKAKKEAEAQAAKKPETAAKIEPAAKAEPSAKAESPAPGGKKKIAYRDGSDLPPCPAPTGAPLGAVDEGSAKAIIERVGCPQCHAYVQKKTGPPMKNIHEKYKGDWECVTLRLTKNKTHKEEGVTDDLKPAEVKIVSDYIATRNK
jgi:cytochrome c551/c552